MEYLIDKIVIYRTDDGVLWLVGNKDEIVTLSPTANRLLNAILDGRDNPIHRDDLLEKVWGEYGLVSSTNSLNHYLSQLRKTLSSVGLSEHIIETIPKVGLQFSKDVTVTVVSSNNKNVINHRTVSKVSGRKIIISLCFIIFTFMVIMFFYIKSPGVNETHAVNIGFVDGCPVLSLSEESHVSTEKNINYLTQYMSQHSVRCIKNHVIYFHGDHKFFADGKGKVFLSICMLNDGAISSCENHLTQDWSAPL